MTPLAKIELSKNFVLPKLVSVGTIVKMRDVAWTWWPVYKACSCPRPVDLDNEDDHLIDFNGTPVWCDPRAHYERDSVPDPKCLISEESVGLVIDCVYWQGHRSQPLWMVLIGESVVCMNETYLVAL